MKTSADFIKRDETIFVCFDDIIRCSKVKLMKHFNENPVEGLSEYLDLTPISDMDEKNLLRRALTTYHSNPLTELVNEDYIEDDIEDKDEHAIIVADSVYKMFSGDIEDLINDAPAGRVVGTIAMLFKQKFVNHIYFYSEVFDIRVLADIDNQFGQHEGRWTYVHGDLATTIKGLTHKPTFYFLNKAYYLNILLSLGEDIYNYTEVTLADVGYNYVYDELSDSVASMVTHTEEEFTELIMKFGMFTPFVMDETYFTSNDYVDMLSQSFISALNETEDPVEREAIINLVKTASDHIDDVKSNGDTSMQIKIDDQMIEPGVPVDDPSLKLTNINKL